MILYDPLSGDACTTPVALRPRTCFLMTKLGKNVPPVVDEIRERIAAITAERNINIIDANSITTGKDFLLKIWRLIVSVPVGIAIIYKSMPKTTMSNVFYEVGLMQALGKETLIVKEPSTEVPSDFVRTEYISFDKSFDLKLKAFLDSLKERADYFGTVAEQLERNPLLSIDYYRRAYLLTGDEKRRKNAAEVLTNAGLDGRSKNSVELLLASFCYGKFSQGA